MYTVTNSKETGSILRAICVSYDGPTDLIEITRPKLPAHEIANCEFAKVEPVVGYGEYTHLAILHEPIYQAYLIRVK